MKKIYLASGWFNPTQAEELTRLEEICDSRKWIDLASPRRIFVCPPNAPKETQDATFDGNLHHIKTADFLIVNTRDKDIGTIWEAGYAFANDVLENIKIPELKKKLNRIIAEKLGVQIDIDL